MRFWSNTLVSVRQVTQRNTGRRTAGIDGEVALTSPARAEVDPLNGFAGRAASQHGVEHVVGDDGGSAAVVAFAGRGVQSFQHRLANRFPLGLGHGTDLEDKLSRVLSGAAHRAPQAPAGLAATVKTRLGASRSLACSILANCCPILPSRPKETNDAAMSAASRDMLATPYATAVVVRRVASGR
ncbi:reverse transcriptase N-terminal domain-containing protein [Streptosporangium sp. NPDC005286]|uniref:reverse transcriptase N-terminal domain-containing protein n=1 Tax=Streptosporangium sp. NPDC005286 TaxID=3154463 RepID=UPI0033A5907F